jgi:hypothetical protein
LLTLYNIGTEEVRGEIRGKAYKGLIYYALNEKGEKVGAPFNSSLFGKPVGIDALEQRIEKSAKIIKDKKLKERGKRIISEVIQQPKSRVDFEKALEKQGISVLFRENEQGRIYGVTFIDHEQKCVFNGSRLGKEFSANSLNLHFGRMNEVYEGYEQKTYQSLNPISLGLDLFDSGSSVGDDIAEQDLARRLRKKKQKRI